MNKYFLVTLLLFSMAMSGYLMQGHNKTHKNMAKFYYCEYCGHRAQDVRTLLAAPCPRHPEGSNKGRHKLYEGSEKSQYICKYCGRKFPSIMTMTAAPCAHHPNGSNKGKHSPAL